MTAYMDHQFYLTKNLIDIQQYVQGNPSDPQISSQYIFDALTVTLTVRMMNTFVQMKFHDTRSTRKVSHTF